ncbi:HD domain-containing protein [Neomoorella humiferrea]|uniref:HD domain protein n=1 Tax=Neomoorella humiferrea TaxID=676965 RepID=A0A2T0AXY7_9FIRM|nr:HD domain-containing protein [Moorella humiferrea]PRR75749.1 HD domain protein [Moorella humiferrea]
MPDNYTPNIATISPTTSLGEAIATIINTGSFVLKIAGAGDNPEGWLNYLDILKIIQDAPEGATLRARRIKDYIHPDNNAHDLYSVEKLLAQALENHAREQELRLVLEELINVVIAEAPVGLAFLNPQGEILHLNSLAEQLLQAASLSCVDLIKMANNNETKTIRANSRTYKLWVVKSGKEKAPGYLAIFVDVTTEQQLVEKVKYAQQEAEMALATLLPDQRVEARLRAIVEYMDEYDSATGRIKITGVIREGVYRHVINILRLIAELSKQGLTELPGIDKDVLVQAAIFHDLAKVQPYLHPGDVVDPQEVFEPGYVHAFRSASMARGIYNIDERTVNLIKYHHHEENDLPAEYPLYLLPMYRLFRLLDGLSAGITRRGSRVKLTTNGTLISVREESSFPLYNQHLELDLYSGRKVVKPLD